MKCYGIMKNEQGGYFHIGDPCPLCKVPMDEYDEKQTYKTEDREVQETILGCGHRMKYNWRTGVLFDIRPVKINQSIYRLGRVFE